MSVIPPTPAQPSRLKKLFAPPVFADEEKTRIASLANAFLWTELVVMVLATLIISPLLPQPIIMIVTGIVICLPLIVALILVRRGSVRAASIIIVAPLWLILVVLGIYSGGIINGGFAALILTILIAGLLLGSKSAVIVAGLSMIGATIAYALEMTGQLPPPLGPISPVNYWVTHLVNYVIAGLLIYLAVRNLATALQRARRNEQALAQSNDELQIVRESLEQRVLQRTAQLEASAAVGQAIAAILDVDQLLREVVNLITTRFGFYYAAVFTLGPTGRFAVLREATGEAGRLLKERGHQLEVGGQSMVGAALSQRKSQIALDVDVEATHFANVLLPETRAEIALPLVVGERLLGALDVQSTQDAAFDTANAVVLQSMADQIAVALNNAEQFKQTEQQAQQQSYLNQFSRNLFAASTAEDLYRALATDLSNLVPHDYLSLTMAQSGSTTLREYPLQAATDRVLAEGPVWSMTNTLSGRACTTHQPAVSAQLAQDSTLNDAAQWELAGFQSALSLPLIVGERVLGTLNFASRQPGAFSPAGSTLLEQLAGQVAAALENQRLAQAQQTSLREMETLTRQLTGQAWAKRRQRQATESVQYARSGLDADRHASTPEMEAAMEQRAPVARSEPGGPDKPSLYQAAMAVPIVLRGEVLGALQVGEKGSTREWTKDDLTFMQAVADQVALALDNARLIEETERRAERERVVADISSRMFASNNLETIVQIAGEELGHILQVKQTTVKIRSELTEAAAQPGNGQILDQYV
jgi:GAF domain-containing protein